MVFDGIPRTSGIYAIVNRTNGHRDVGSARNIRSRLRQHVRELERGTHRTSEEQLLQNAWDEFGRDSFEFRVLDWMPLRGALPGRRSSPALDRACE